MFVCYDDDNIQHSIFVIGTSTKYIHNQTASKLPFMQTVCILMKLELMSNEAATTVEAINLTVTNGIINRIWFNTKHIPVAIGAINLGAINIGAINHRVIFIALVCVQANLTSYAIFRAIRCSSGY